MTEIDQNFSLHKTARVAFVTALVVGLSSSLFAGGYFWGRLSSVENYSDLLAQNLVKGENQEQSYPLLKYSFSELANRGGIASEITIKREFEKTADTTSYVFTYETEGKTMSGLLTVPTKTDPNQSLPVLVMLRGFVPPEDYAIGKGSKNTAISFARQGYVTFAPDFLGFGESDSPPAETLAERFIKPANIMDLIASIEQLSEGEIVYKNQLLASVNPKRLGMWGHSNGGQIGISVLEITGRPIPFVMWAPVTKSFPYSVLYFTDEYEDQGKSLRAVISGFERNYNINEFSIGFNLEKVSGPLQLHQGTADDAVPKSWSDDFYSFFVGKGKKEQIEYYTYTGADHGLNPNVEEVLARSLAFFDRNVKYAVLTTPTPTPTNTPTATPTLKLTTPTATVSATATPSGAIRR